MKKSYKSNEFKISEPTWNGTFELLDRLYSVFDIQYLNSIFFILNISLKNHETLTDNPPIRIYVNKIENRITFKIKTGYYLKLLTTETVKLLGSSKNEINKDKNWEDVPYSEITEVVLIHCDIINHVYSHDSRVLYTFVSNKSFGQ